MPLSLKVELEIWAAALKAYDEEDFEKALGFFSRIANSSRILTNMGLIYATLGEHEAAVGKFIEATGLDNYLAVAHFQCGVSNFLLARYDLAYKDFEEALHSLRTNQAINYEQLGLKFRLFSAEVLFNKGLSQIYMRRMEDGLADMQEAKKDKATDEHNVIDDAIADRGEGHTVFRIPVGVLYRPSEKKLKNAAAKCYMGKPVLIVASDSRDARQVARNNNPKSAEALSLLAPLASMVTVAGSKLKELHFNKPLFERMKENTPNFILQAIGQLENTASGVTSRAASPPGTQNLSGLASKMDRSSCRLGNPSVLLSASMVISRERRLVGVASGNMSTPSAAPLITSPTRGNP